MKPYTLWEVCELALTLLFTASVGYYAHLVLSR